MWRIHRSSDPIKPLSNSLFSKTFTSFIDNPFISSTPFSSSLTVSSSRGTNRVGLYTAKPIPSNEVILAMSPELTGLVIDGVHNIPLELSQLLGFSNLCDEIKTILIIAFHKANDHEHSSPLGFLWKGVGVDPIPDHRWIKYKGLFTVANGTVTGIDEIDEAVIAAANTVSETLIFSRSHNLQRLFGITETEIKWSYIFLHAFGVIEGVRKIIIAPLVFARHSINQAKTLSLTRSPIGTIDITCKSPLDRGEELVVDGKSYLSDSYAFLFHGSWVGDNSIHRGKLMLRHDKGSEMIEFWFSNIDEESVVFRENLLGKFLAFEDSDEWSDFRAIDNILMSLVSKMESIQPQLTSTDSTIERIRFIYVNGLVGEIDYFKTLSSLKRKELFDF